MRLPWGSRWSAHGGTRLLDALRRSLWTGSAALSTRDSLAPDGVGCRTATARRRACRARSFSPHFQRPPWRPFQVFLVRFSACAQVTLFELADLVTAHVHGDASALCKHSTRGVGVTRHEVLTDERVRNAVVMPLDIDVVVDVTFTWPPLGIFIALAGSGLKAGRSMASNASARQARQFLERRRFRSTSCSGDRDVKLGEREELGVRKRARIHSAPRARSFPRQVCPSGETPGCKSLAP